MLVRMKKCICFSLLFLIVVSCKDVEKERITHLVKEWSGKEVFFPEHSVFTVQGQDTINFKISDSGYKIVTYVDSIGCSSCKLKLLHWKGFVNDMDTVANVQFLFFFHPKSMQGLLHTIREDNFTYPVCFDEKDEFNNRNQFPSEMAFQTFLLDKDNRVVAIGNPIHNAQVKELYKEIILGDKAPPSQVATSNHTEITVSTLEANWGKFDSTQEKITSFTLINVGNKPLVIADVITSCGCTTVDYTKEPTRPGGNVTLNVKYKADSPGYFNKSITVICNAKKSPLTFLVKGEAQ